MIRLFIFICLFSSVSFAQITFDKTTYDFGDVFQYTPRFVDIFLKNTGTKQAYLLRVVKPKNVYYITSKSLIDPDSSMIIRFQVNPLEEGKFNYKIPVYVSDRDEAVTIELKGNLKETPNLSQNPLQACPDFNKAPGEGNPLDFLLTVVTIEKGTNKILSNSIVSLVQNGELEGQFKTNSKGQIQQKVPLGYTYFYATHEGYSPVELGTYINFQSNYVVLKLEKDANLVPENLIVEEKPKTPEIELTIPEKEDTTVAIFSVPDTSKITIPALANIPVTDFSPEHFKPNNIVFVLDISMSMNSNDKMELMKFALNQLAGYIRPQDKISIVTYASTTQVMLPPTSGENAEEIKKIVTSLKGGGFTAGGAGIEMGYKQVQKGYIENGNNEIILITDGAFNRESSDYKKNMKKLQNKGFKLSVVGVKNAPKDEVEMKTIAEIGQGRYIPIFKLEDAKWNLIQEIRQASFNK